MMRLILTLLACLLAVPALAAEGTITIPFTFDMPPGEPGLPGAPGAPGSDGCSVLRGTGDPAPELGKPCDSYISDSGFLWQRFPGAWGNPIDLRPQSSLGGMPPQFAGEQPDIADIACSGNITAQVQAAYNAHKWPRVGAGDCTMTSVTFTNGDGHFIGMGNDTKISFTGSGCMFALAAGEGGSTNTYFWGGKFTDNGTGDPTQRHAICVDGLSNNSVIDFIDFRGFQDAIRLRGALSDKSAAFYGVIRNIFAFGQRGCNIRVSRPVAGGVSLVFLKIENVDIGRAGEAAICFEGIRTTDTAVVINGGEIDHGDTPTGQPMPDAIKVRGGFPTTGPGSPYAAFTIIGMNAGAPDFFDSDIAVNVNLIGNSLTGNPSNPTTCGLAINLPGTASDVTCAAADGANISR